MRLVPLALLVALLVVPPAASAEGPHLLVRVLNDGEDNSGRLLVSRSEDEPPFFTRAIALPGGGARTHVAVPAPEGEYVVTLEVDGGAPVAGRVPEGSFPVPLTVYADSRGCPGPNGIDFVFDLGEYVSVEDIGCLVPTPPFLALLEEARAARTGFPRASVDVPLPGSEDRGVYHQPREMPFEWRDGAEWTDAWGRSARGAEVSYLQLGWSGAGSGDILGWAFAETRDTMELLRFEPGALAPSSWTRTFPAAADGGAATPAAALLREVRYDEPKLDAACLLRHGLQGATVRAGDVVDASRLCPHWEGTPFRAAEPIEWRGLRALPLYRVEESDERLLAERILLLDGVPYMAERQRYLLPQDGGVRERIATLERLDPRGAPIDVAAPARAPPAPRLAPLDPLRGPASGADSRLPFPLRDAVDAALADPLLADLRAVASRADAVLAGAAYQDSRDADARGARLTWFLLFRAGDAMGYAACTRVDAGLPVPTPPRCHVPQGPDWMLYGWAHAVLDAPPMTRALVPSQAPSWSDTTARWDLLRPGGAGERPTFALYRPWEGAEAPFLAVGRAPVSGTLPSGGTTQGDYAALRLDGATLAAVELTQTRGDFNPAMLAPVHANLRAGDRGPAFADELPLLAGAGIAAGLGLLALAALLLYSRLARSRVLDDATRAALLDVVAREPGLHASGILAQLDKRSGVGEYHLGVLVREGFLVCVTTPGFRRYFVSGRYAPQQMRAMAALREGVNGAIYGIIRDNPGIPLAGVAERAQVSMAYASKSVSRLAEAGLVDKLQSGRAVQLHAREAPDALGRS